MKSSTSRKRWHEGGTGDSVMDLARQRAVEPDQEPNPRAGDGRPRLTRSADAVTDITIIDPLSVMIECEEQDEALGCEPGTHFNERIRRIQETH